MSSSACQVVLVPVGPVIAQPNSSSECYQPASLVPLTWTQPISTESIWTGPPSSAEQACYAPPPKHGASVDVRGSGPLPVGRVEVPVAAGPAEACVPEEHGSSGSDPWADAALARGAWADAADAPGSGAAKAVTARSALVAGKPHTSSAARRLRRLRAHERAAAFGKPDSPEASEPEADGRGEALANGPENEAAAELLAQLAAGGEAERLAISRMRGSVWPLSCQPIGCRAVQLALERASGSECRALVAELHGHVVEATHSPHANYVIQKVVETLPAKAASFVAEELAGLAGRTARHRFGCRIFCRIMEHRCEDGSAAATLIGECMEEAEDLCRHAFGHYVMKAILEHGTGAQRHRIAQAIRIGPRNGQGHRSASGLMRNALHRNASYVLESCLECCSLEDQDQLARELLTDSGVAALGQSPHGSHVVKAMLRVPGIAPAVLARLHANAEALKTSKHGYKLLQDLRFGAAKPLRRLHTGAAAA